MGTLFSERQPVMFRKALALKVFEAFSIQRWNDKLRPVELSEMDKHAHKMIIAYCLGKYEEESGRTVEWEKIIENGIFELLRRVITSDIKSPVYRQIRLAHPEVFNEFNSWVYNQLLSSLGELPEAIKANLKGYLFDSDGEDSLARKILEAAHIFSSFWEFQILRQAHPEGYQMKEIDKSMHNNLEPYLDLTGMRRIICKEKASDFIDLCGQLRFQIRWGQIPRVPRTSVLGHMLLVAVFAYFFSQDIRACPKRLFNNFFGALFHDLPEVSTRDILSPIKKSVEGMPEVISKIEEELAEKEIFPLIESTWRKEMKYFTRDEFTSRIRLGTGIRPVTTDEINEKYNADQFDPIDGELIRMADDLAAYLEAYVSACSGISSRQLEEAMKNLEERYRGKSIGGIAIGSLYADFR